MPMLDRPEVARHRTGARSVAPAGNPWKEAAVLGGIVLALLLVLAVVASLIPGRMAPMIDRTEQVE